MQPAGGAPRAPRLRAPLLLCGTHCLRCIVRRTARSQGGGGRPRTAMATPCVPAAGGAGARRTRGLSSRGTGGAHGGGAKPALCTMRIWGSPRPAAAHSPPSTATAAASAFHFAIGKNFSTNKGP